MARIAVLMFPEPGHLLPTIRLSRRLRADGHWLCYLTRPAYCHSLRSCGFEACPVFGETEEEQGFAQERLPSAALWDAVSSGVDFWNGLARRLRMPADSRIGAVIRAAAPTMIAPALASIDADVLLCDSKIASACEDILCRASPGATFVGLRTQLPIGEQATHPDLVLCPADLELPFLRRGSSTRVYCEPSVMSDRQQGCADVGDGRDGDRLVFCSLGTQATTYSGAIDVLRSVTAAFAGRRGYRLVVAAGRLVDHLALRCDEENTEVHATVDQVDVLRRASVAILHGGLGGVKEAVLAGVPMVIVPFVFDQRPNAERVVAHNLGTMVLPLAASPERIVEAVEDVLGSETVSVSVVRMQEVFLQAEARQLAYELVSQALQGKPLL